MAVSLETLIEAAEELIVQAQECAPGLLDAGALEVPERLRRGRLTLAVLGQFKRGKSTLINALVGAEILPASVLPLTSVITSVVHGTSPALTVKFQDGREEVHEVSALPSFVTEAQNPENAKGVAWARVAWPSPFLARPVRVVDTPGVGSAYDHNTEVSEGFLPHVDASIFVLGVDPILTETELAWLGRVRHRAQAFFFVLNKSDQLSREEVEEVVRFARRRLAELWGTEVRVFPLSARRALEEPEEGDFLRFREQVEAFLDREGEETLLRSARRKLCRAGHDALSALALQREAARRSSEELKSRLQDLSREEEKTRWEQPRAEWVLEEAASRILKEFRELADARWEGSREEVLQALRAAWDGSRTVGQGRSEMRRVLESGLEVIFARLATEAESTGAAHFEQAVAFLTAEYQSCADRLLEVAGGWFGLRLPSVSLEIPDPPRSRFYVLVPPELAGISSAGGSVINLLPRSWAGRWASKGVLGKVDFFFGMQRDRLLSDLAERFQTRSAAVALDLREHTRAILDRLRESILRGLELRSGSEEERSQAESLLAAREERIRNLTERIGGEDLPEEQ